MLHIHTRPVCFLPPRSALCPSLVSFSRDVLSCLRTLFFLLYFVAGLVTAVGNVLIFVCMYVEIVRGINCRLLPLTTVGCIAQATAKPGACLSVHPFRHHMLFELRTEVLCFAASPSMTDGPTDHGWFRMNGSGSAIYIYISSRSAPCRSGAEGQEQGGLLAKFRFRCVRVVCVYICTLARSI